MVYVIRGSAKNHSHFFFSQERYEVRDTEERDGLDLRDFSITFFGKDKIRSHLP